MDAITLWQPHASLIAVGAKPYETRHWAPSQRLVGKRIAIHAAARKPTRSELDGLLDDVSDALGVCHWHLRIPYGAVVCTAKLAGVYLVDKSGSEDYALVVDRISGSPRLDRVKIDAFGNYAPGRWCWHLTEVESFKKPVAIKGAQGWWRWAPAGQLITAKGRAY